MEEKDKFEMFNQPDAFDKMLFDYYKNKATQLPLSTQSTIENALNSTKSKEENTILMFLARWYSDGLIYFLDSINVIKSI